MYRTLLGFQLGDLYGLGSHSHLAVCWVDPTINAQLFDTLVFLFISEPDLTRQVWLVRRVLSAQDNSQANNSLGTFRGGFSE